MGNALLEKTRGWDETATPYQLARNAAGQAISIYAGTHVVNLKPFDPKLAVTVVAGRPRRTRESHAALQGRARETLAALITALKDPSEMPRELASGFPNVAVAIFALTEADRSAMAAQFQEKLDEYPA